MLHLFQNHKNKFKNYLAYRLFLHFIPTFLSELNSTQHFHL